MKRILLRVIFLTLFFYFFIFFTFIVPLWAKGRSWEIGWLSDLFIWKEFDDNGTLELGELGLRYGVNINWWNKEALTYYTFWDFTIYGGNSSLYLGDKERDVSYFGIGGEAGIGFPTDIIIWYIPIKTVSYLGLVFDYWSKSRSVILSKDLGYEDDEESWHVYEDLRDYKERWAILFWKIGVKSEIELVFMQLGVNLWLGSDILSRKKIDFSNIDFNTYFNTYYKGIKEVTPETIELKPDGSFFYGIDLTLKFNKFFIRGYYKYFKWNKSPEEEIYVKYGNYYSYYYSDSDYDSDYEETSISVSQPESEEKYYGIVIGLVF